MELFLQKKRQKKKGELKNEENFIVSPDIDTCGLFGFQ